MPEGSDVDTHVLATAVHFRLIQKMLFRDYSLVDVYVKIDLRNTI